MSLGLAPANFRSAIRIRITGSQSLSAYQKKNRTFNFGFGQEKIAIFMILPEEDIESSGLRILAECSQSIVGSFTKLSMYEVSNFCDDRNVRKV